MTVESFLTANRVVGIRPGSNGEVVCQCPFCNKPKHFSFNRAKLTYQCFACGLSGNAFQIVKRQSPSLTDRQAFELMEEHGLQTNGKTKKPSNAGKLSQRAKELLAARDDKALDTLARQWAVTRQTLADLQYSFGKNDRGQPAFVFPMFDGAKLTGEQTWRAR